MTFYFDFPPFFLFHKDVEFLLEVKEREKGGVVLAARITSPIQLASRARRRDTSKGERRAPTRRVIFWEIKFVG
jgi:hypothetical protein